MPSKISILYDYNVSSGQKTTLLLIYLKLAALNLFCPLAATTADFL